MKLSFWISLLYFHIIKRWSHYIKLKTMIKYIFIFLSGEVWCKRKRQREGGKSRSRGDIFSSIISIIIINIPKYQTNLPSPTGMSLATSTRGRTPRLDDDSKTHNDANCTQYQGLTHKREHTPMYANTKPLFSPRADTSKIGTMYICVFSSLHQCRLSYLWNQGLSSLSP